MRRRGEENVVRVAADRQPCDDLPGIDVVHQHYGRRACSDKEAPANFVQRHRKIVRGPRNLPRLQHFTLGAVDDCDMPGSGHIHEYAASVLLELEGFRMTR